MIYLLNFSASISSSLKENIESVFNLCHMVGWGLTGTEFRTVTDVIFAINESY